MSNAEDYIVKDSDADFDELHQLLGETFTSEGLSAEANNMIEDEYSVSTIEGLYADSDEMAKADSIAVPEDSANEGAFDSVSLKRELEELFRSSDKSSAEDDAGTMSALDDLKAFLGDSVQTEAVDEDIFSMSAYDDALTSHRSILDELQALLQSCIDALKTDPDSIIDDASASVEYPSREELQHLLETRLSQLMMLTDAPLTDVSELFDSDTVKDVTDIASDSIIDELNLLLADASFGTVEPAEDEYSVTDTVDSLPVLDELDAYMAELSSNADTDDEYALDETMAETGAETVSASSTIEELAAMLDEISASGKNESPNGSMANEDDLSSVPESTIFSATENVDEVAKENNVTDASATAAFVAKTAIVDVVVADVEISHEPDNTGRSPMFGLLFAVVFIAGVYGIWGFLDTGNKIEHQPEKLLRSSMIEESPVPVESAEVDSIYGLLEKMKTSSYVPVSAYEDKPLSIETTDADVENRVILKLPMKDAGNNVADDLETVLSLQINAFQQESRDSIDQLNKRMIEAEVAIAILQVEKIITDKQRNNTSSVSTTAPVVPEKPKIPVKQAFTEKSARKISGANTLKKSSNLWSVHLSSYYGRPPSAGELVYLDNAGISYQIKKAMVNEKTWYRVIVDEFAEYEKAKKYSERIRKNIGRNDIWVNRSQ